MPSAVAEVGRAVGAHPGRLLPAVSRQCWAGQRPLEQATRMYHGLSQCQWARFHCQGYNEDQKARFRLEEELDRVREELLRWAGARTRVAVLIRNSLYRPS